MAESWRNALGSERLLVSGFGKWGGGLYDLTSGTPMALDDLPTSGVTLGGDRFWRVLRAPGEQTAACELLSYDNRGIRTYQRLDAIQDPHDVCWHDGAVHITSSWDSTVWRVGTDSSLEAVWRGGAIPDSWHVNSLVEVEGRLHVCAFGRFDEYKGWKQDQGQKAGFVHDTERGLDVLTGLSHPHNPHWAGDRWYICESTKGALLECDEQGRELRRVVIRRFSRGLALLGRWALVGGNAHREDEDDRAEIAVIDLYSFAVVERIAMPCLEVYDIVPVPFALARGVALGFGSNPARAVEQHRGYSRVPERRPTPAHARVGLVPTRVADKLAAAGEALDPEIATRCGAYVQLPDQVPAGSVQLLPVVVENRSRLAIATVVPEPIRVSVRWIPLDGQADEAGGDPAASEEVIRNPFAPLPRLLHPGERAEADVILAAPAEPGRYEVRVALHQPSTGWFGRRSQAEIEVTPADGAAEVTDQTADQAADQAEGSVTRP